MKELAKTSRINRALQVIQYANDGMTVSDACTEVGLPRSSFYYIVINNPDAFLEVQEIIRAGNLHQLASIVLKKVHIVEKMIQDGLADDTSPQERIAILREMDRQMDQLMEALHINDQNVTEAAEFLKQGPKTAMQESRLP